MKFRILTIFLLLGLAAGTPAQAYSVTDPAFNQNLGPLDLGTNTVSGRISGSCRVRAGRLRCIDLTFLGSQFETELQKDLRLASLAVNLTEISGDGAAFFFEFFRGQLHKFAVCTWIDRECADGCP